MADKELVDAVKAIVALVRAKETDQAYAGYKALFSSPEFRTYPPADQRQALKLMIHAKGLPFIMPPHMVEAHRACIEPLTELVSVHNDPADYEMLGMCHVAVGNEAGASSVFRAGLAIERERNTASQ